MLVNPQGVYSIVSRNDNVLYTAGITPRKDGKLIEEGKINDTREITSYQILADQIIDNLEVALNNTLEDREQVDRILDMMVFVSIDPGFYKISRVADLVSNAIIRKWGEGVIGARTAVGVYGLPSNAPLEVKFTIKVK
ncbi:RidA family protein [uncultured Veillonella sp.]|uniref:RidA family protein n=1 Tax=uncultured Veillonella sp. TaxID=159268 RepID=UPI00258B5338|nr:RidA family protein [uncultured Veillonella sp.]